MKTKLFLAASMFLTGILLMSPLAAQEDEGGATGGGKYGTGEDSINCLKNLSLYRQYTRQKSYDEALPFWRIACAVCPTSTKNLYIDGVTLFRYQIDREKEAEKKDLYVDTLMMIYDNRIKYFGERGSVLSRKGIDLLRYRRGDQKYVQEGFDILDESITLLKGKSSAPAMATYFTATVSLYNQKVIPAEKVVEIWGKLIGYIEEGITKNSNDKTLLEVKSSVMALFIKSGAATPETLTKFYEPLVDATPDNLPLLKEVAGGFSNINAEDNPFCIRVSELLYAKEPSAQAAYNLAKLFAIQKSFKKSSDYYKEAIAKEPSDEVKAKYYYELASITSNLDNAPQARTYALEAAKLKDSWGAPYILIAKLYANSSSTCGSKNLEKRSVFWAAVDKCNKAKSIDPEVAEEANSLIANYSNFFPEREDTFYEGYTDGQTYTVGCWIGENTLVRTRK